MKKGIIFDVDGTLWDSVLQIMESWNCCLREQYPQISRVVTAKDLYENIGKTSQQFEEILFPDLDHEFRHEVMEACMEFETGYLEAHPGTLYPGAQRILKQLSREYELFIVSNCQIGYIEGLIKNYDLLDDITDTECFGRTGCTKGDNVRMVIERNHLDKCFYVGDTYMDRDAANKAGIPFVYAAYGFGDLTDAPEAIRSFDELPAVAKKLLGNDD
jgi:phosphoglycolate phosphatase